MPSIVVDWEMLNGVERKCDGWIEVKERKKSIVDEFVRCFVGK
jgi:hypothetical protein